MRDKLIHVVEVRPLLLADRRDPEYGENAVSPRVPVVERSKSELRLVNTKPTIKRRCVCVALVAMILFDVHATAQTTRRNWLKAFKDPSKGLQLAREGMFFVDGQYYTSAVNGLKYMAGQMYVEYKIPMEKTHPYPIVMIHGAAQTGTNFIATPDDRPGWAQFFVANGYSVFVVDQTGRGRAAYSTEMYGPFRFPYDVLGREKEWTLQQEYKTYPNAELHTQWPGTGREGDPFFDQFYASQVPLMADAIKTQKYAQAAGVALLDRIGPAIILTHSQSGTFGFLIADARPNLVKAVVTVEGGGRPTAATTTGYGVTSIPITYSPPVTSPSQLEFSEQPAEKPDLVSCWLQRTPAHQLPNLQKMPHLLIAGEASAAAGYNHCIARYLTQAGVKNTSVNLGDVGIHGNGHMMMLEKNELEIAAFIADWLAKNVKKTTKRKMRTIVSGGFHPVDRG